MKLKDDGIQYLLFLLLFPVIAFSQSQPDQASIGPGGTDYIHGGVTEYFADSAGRSYWIFQPEQPKPDSADLVIFNHGLGQINPKVHAGWITHLVRKGNIVIYPKYQDDLNTPTDSFMLFAADGIKLAIAEMEQVGYVAPRLNNFAMVGHSYGGAISANLAYLYLDYGLPQVKALMVAQGYYGTDMLLPSYRNFPYDTKMQLVVGSSDDTVDSTFARLLMDSANVDPLFKNYIKHFPDNHNPAFAEAVSAEHTDPICISPLNDYDSGESNFWVLGAEFFNKIDLVDYYCYWKLSEALLDCTFYGQNCEYAFGDTPEQRFMGLWSDSVPVVGLEVEPQAPTAIENLKNERIQLSIWPNPTQNSIQIETTVGIPNVTMELYSALGQLIWQRDELYIENGYRVILPESVGLYYLVIRDKTKSVSKKIIKLK
jgi:pimeloyl-ACP methyl ester carboxylesterase